MREHVEYRTCDVCGATADDKPCTIDGAFKSWIWTISIRERPFEQTKEEQCMDFCSGECAKAFFEGECVS